MVNVIRPFHTLIHVSFQTLNEFADPSAKVVEVDSLVCDHNWFLSNSTCFRLVNISNLINTRDASSDEKASDEDNVNVPTNGISLFSDDSDNDATKDPVIEYLEVVKKQDLLNVYSLIKSLNVSSDMNFEANPIEDARINPLLEYLSIIKEEKQVCVSLLHREKIVQLN